VTWKREEGVGGREETGRRGERAAFAVPTGKQQKPTKATDLWVSEFWSDRINNPTA
jgi:hypothetical protein